MSFFLETKQHTEATTIKNLRLETGWKFTALLIKETECILISELSTSVSNRFDLESALFCVKRRQKAPQFISFIKMTPHTTFIAFLCDNFSKIISKLQKNLILRISQDNSSNLQRKYLKNTFF